MQGGLVSKLLSFTMIVVSVCFNCWATVYSLGLWYYYLQYSKSFV